MSVLIVTESSWWKRKYLNYTSSFLIKTVILYNVIYKELLPLIYEEKRTWFSSSLLTLRRLLVGFITMCLLLSK